ncbi:MAG: sugar transferase [Leuconostoc gelidum]|jgi:hypothetical protein|uniref:sugar transferase n=1 Tax=Leuconostoc gelidum TaxID=1244 RepID=UPI001576C9EE|nr:sugar transferase [Leuconostoc gelidum]MBZ6001950.1 sugar transferase [Leuconostoc gelidum subsp. gelidum]QDJ30368.1 hypothetical protein BHS02_06860 [Leuconostoc gelidum subsp. gelidum]
MTRWMTDIIQGIDSGATFKARNDISIFAEQIGLRRLPIFRYDSAFENSDAIHARIDGITAGVKRGDTVYYQFPTYNGARFENFFVDHMAVRGISMVVLVHDIEFLRFPTNNTFNEIDYLNKCNIVIVHNQYMADILQENGVSSHMVNLNMFDYHIDTKIDDRDSIEKQVIVAGSLNKALYLKDWQYDLPIVAYGRQPDFSVSTRVDYRGSLSPDEVAQKLPSGFGLSWDTNTSTYENSEYYSKFNIPHKVSLYLSSGLPVIVKTGTAIAKVVATYNLGLVIDSLDNLKDNLQNISPDELLKMVIQVNHFRKLLMSGYFTKQAIMNAEFQLTMGYPERNLL